MDSDTQLEDQAFEFVRRNPNLLVQKFCGTCTSVETPVSLFMAGSPGAGKTEVSVGLIQRFETVPVRIDADEIRKLCPGYVGTNAHLFQKAANKGVNILYDYALKKGLHVILDGTFAYALAIQNIERSLKRNRAVELWYVYQDPEKAWLFTIAREAEESRHVSKKDFIRAFIAARENVKKAKEQFGSSLILNLLVKNVDNTDGKLHLNVNINELDSYTGQSYTESSLESLLENA